MNTECLKNISALIGGSVWPLPEIYESDLLQSDFQYMQSLDKNKFAWGTSSLLFRAKRAILTEYLKYISALIRGSVWPMPDIMRVIWCSQIFSICKAGTRKSSHGTSNLLLGMVTECLKNIFALIGGSVSPIPEIMRVIGCGQIFGIYRAWTRTSSHEEWVACYLGWKGHGQRMPKNISALIGGGVWPIPEIMRVICCCQIFGIYRAWNWSSSHNEQVACYLGQKGHGHRMPKKHFCTNPG